tara:strand:- start:121 stop:354 length:234 start_codon:yes stop_codon:yes gene_type:complete
MANFVAFVNREKAEDLGMLVDDNIFTGSYADFHNHPGLGELFIAPRGPTQIAEFERSSHYVRYTNDPAYFMTTLRGN